MTLIEVLAALAILATLLWGVLSAKARAERQLARADRKLTAIYAADQLLGQWWAAGRVPVPANGVFPHHASWQWRTQIVTPSSPAAWNAQIAELQVVDLTDQTGAPVLVSVQFLLPAPQNESTTEPSQPEAHETH